MGRKYRHGLIKATNVDTGVSVMFASQAMAAKHLGVYQANVSACLSGRLNKTGRWKFEYVNNERR